MPQPKPILSFPEMLPASRGRAVPGVSYLDPGLAPEGDEYYFPENLPLSRAEAAGWLSQAVGFAELFKKPGELLSAYASGGNDFYAGTAQAIVSELRAMDKPREDAAEAESRKGLVRAQAVLLLARQREQALAEISGLDDGVEASWDGMAEALGLEADDAVELAEVAAHVRPELDTSLYPAADEWLPVLESMLRLTPADAALFVDDPALLSWWLEQGLEFAPAEDAAGLPEGQWMTLTATGAALTGRGDGEGALAAPRLVLTTKGALDAL